MDRSSWKDKKKLLFSQSLSCMWTNIYKSPMSGDGAICLRNANPNLCSSSHNNEKVNTVECSQVEFDLISVRF